MEILIVVDMQNDFVSGALGTPEAQEITPYVVKRVADGINRGETVLFTQDTHTDSYPETQEGRRLPVPHCIQGTEGWEIIPQLTAYTAGRTVLEKPTFGSAELGGVLRELDAQEPVQKITLIGLCTDICVLSNAMLAKAFLPEADIVVDASCCAGVTPESHRTALAAMPPCQITVENM